MNKVRYYLHLLRTDRKAFRFQLWMVWNRHKINFIKWCFVRYAASTKNFLTIHHRPLYAQVVDTWPEPTQNHPRTAMVLQGRITHEYDFTLETVRLYKNHYPTAIVIVSTDIGEPAPAITALENAGAVVVQSQKPAVNGLGNVNLQLVSTLAGIQKAKELGAEFVYKSRCDQRIYAPNTTNFLLELLRAFPTVPGSSQKYRIIASSMATLKYVPYLVTDMLQFGHIDDMLLYWSAPLDERSKPSKLIHTVQDLSDECMAESYLCSTYLKALGHTPTWTVTDSWQAYAKYFCIVDRHTLDLFWYKYDFYKEHAFKRYDGASNDTLLTFADWLVLYSHRDNPIQAPESGLSLGRRDLLPAQNV